MNTPIVKLTLDDKNTVYDPSEDSFLLIDALETDLELIKSLNPLLCVEIGCGSGIVITALAMALKSFRKSHFIAIDINPSACTVAKHTSVCNLVDVDVVQMDLLTAVRSKQIFDLIIFNPPYVLTDTCEIFSQMFITKAWAGGKYGREVMERVFKQIPYVLSDTGMFYLVVIKENDPQYIMDIFQVLNMTGTVVAERKIRGEHLFVLRFTKCKLST